MARNDVHAFASFEEKSKEGVGFNLSTNTLKLAIVNNALTPSVGMSDPRWGSGGSNDFSAHEVAHGTSYTGPITLTGVTYTRSGNVMTLAASNLSTLPLDSSGFTNGYYAIIYNDTVSGKYALGWLDLGGPISLQLGALIINWNSAGIFTHTVA